MDKIKKLLTSDKLGKYLFVIALIGIALIFISTLNFGEKENYISDTEYDYSSETEDKLKSIIKKITGEKNVEVFVSLDNSEQTIYADSVKTSVDLSEDTVGGETSKRDNKEQEYIIVEDSDGKQQALVVTTVAPTVKGVVVVSKCASDPIIKEEIVNAVTTALNISSKKVCVVGVYN